MKKNVIAVGVAAVVAGLATSAYAVTDLAGGTANAMAFSDTGVGHALVVPYFSTQNSNSTLLSIINTDTVNGKAVKVRFRGAANSDDIYDFQVFLSPGDVWTANVSANDDGLSTLTTSDNTCTKPSKAVLNATPFVTARLPSTLTGDALATQTREGYIEIFNMADIPPASALFPNIKHVNSVAPCAGTPWTLLNTDTNNATLTGATIGLAAPTTGLAANWTIINVPGAQSWGGAAQAIQAVDAGGAPVTGNVVYFPQVNTPITAAQAAAFTADPLMQGATPVVAGALYDLPDMSTPYGDPVITPSVQAAALSGSLATTAVMNEFWTLPGISGATDWVFSMPTRRYAVAVNYANTVGGVITPAAVYNAGNAGHFAPGNTQMNGSQLCVTGITTSPYDREENTPASPDLVVISPSTPGVPLAFCGEASVLSFNNGGATTTAALGAQVAVKDVATTYTEGWLKLATPGAVAANGLPILGQAFATAYNPKVGSGVSGNFGTGWNHRFTRP